MPTRTYLDSGVFLAAHQSSHHSYAAARAVIADPNRVFVVSDILRLELFPKPTYFKNDKELKFLQAFFADAVDDWALNASSFQDCMGLAGQYGLSGSDALQLSAALSLKAEEFISTEKATKPMYRINSSGSIRATSIHKTKPRQWFVVKYKALLGIARKAFRFVRL
jgi:predicted nucleic acid-binding protein